MDSSHQLAPCLISKGTLSHPRDMLRALETLENLDYRYIVTGELIEEGQAALVKLMADPESATLIVNGCLFLNVASFRYLDFAQIADQRWSFVLHGDSSRLELVSIPETETEEENSRRPHLLSEETVPDFESLIALDDEDDED
jgi:hypothetical protein